MEYRGIERMRKEDLSAGAVIAEAVGMILGIAYMVLQVYYGIRFHVSPVTWIMNVLVAVLVYIGLTILAHYPEKIHALPPEKCSGKVRMYSIRMVRVIKLLFISSLLIPCISDAFGHQMKGGYSLIAIGIMIAAAVYYEYHILHILRSNNQKK